MPEQPAVEETLRFVLADEFGIEQDKITPGARLDEDLNLDSLDLVELAMEAEDQYGIRIDDEQIQSVKTFADMVALVERERG